MSENYPSKENTKTRLRKKMSPKAKESAKMVWTIFFLI